LVAITFDLVSAQTTPDCAIKGVSYTDPNIQTLNGGQPLDAMTCQKACAFTASCHYFTYYTDSKGCWLMTDQAKLNEKGDVPSEAFAVSGAKVCPPVAAKKMNATQPLEELHPDAEGHVTVAPGVEIGPNGPRPVPILGSSMNVTNVATTESSGWNVPYIGVKVPETIWGLHWSWWCLIIAAGCLLCCCLGWCLCCRTSRPRKKASSSGTSQTDGGRAACAATREGCWTFPSTASCTSVADATTGDSTAGFIACLTGTGQRQSYGAAYLADHITKIITSRFPDPLCQTDGVRCWERWSYA